MAIIPDLTFMLRALSWLGQAGVILLFCIIAYGGEVVVNISKSFGDIRNESLNYSGISINATTERCPSLFVKDIPVFYFSEYVNSECTSLNVSDINLRKRHISSFTTSQRDIGKQYNGRSFGTREGCWQFEAIGKGEWEDSNITSVSQSKSGRFSQILDSKFSLWKVGSIKTVNKIGITGYISAQLASSDKGISLCVRGYKMR